jgi:hypothetical protein
VCIDQGGTGFSADKTGRGYNQANFKPLRFTMIKEGDQLRLRVLGRDETYMCSTPWRSKTNLLQCTEKFFFIVFDTDTLRYVRSIMFGWIDKTFDDIGLHYGECQSFD